MTDNLSPSGSLLADGHWDLLVPLRAGSGRPPLFCMHAISGSPYPYRELASLLPGDQPVYGFEAPGFDNDRAPVTALSQLADEYTVLLRAAAPGQEYRLLGWSAGGLMAFEIAKRLRAAGEEVTKLILVDAHLPRIQPLPPERELLLWFIYDMMGMPQDESVSRIKELFKRWPADVDPAAVFPLVEQVEILPEEMDTVLLADQYAVFRALVVGLYAIEAAGSYDGEALHILAQDSPRHETDWRKLLPRVREVTLPGTHYTIWSGQSLVLMSEIIRATLAVS